MVGGDHSIGSFTDLADLASARVGGRARSASDDFFASRANLVKPAAPIFIPGKFTARGKWMDGWESRRKRTPGHDWCIVALGLRGVIRGIDVDTSHFSGNQPSHCSIDALDTASPAGGRRAARGGVNDPRAPWVPVLPQSALNGNSHNLFAIDSPRPWTHVRLNIFPDGGVARLRVYGEAEIDWTLLRRSRRPIDLAAIVHGGLVLAASDMHFGAKDNLIMPGRAVNMADGWETRRRRGPGHDWVIVRLGAPGIIQRVEIDTTHFKGNYPDRASIDGCLAPGADTAALSAVPWPVLLPESTLRAHHRHFYTSQLAFLGPISHVRLNIFPDGGVSRLRVHGTAAAP